MKENTIALQHLSVECLLSAGEMQAFRLHHTVLIAVYRFIVTGEKTSDMQREA